MYVECKDKYLLYRDFSAISNKSKQLNVSVIQIIRKYQYHKCYKLTKRYIKIQKYMKYVTQNQ